MEMAKAQNWAVEPEEEKKLNCVYIPYTELAE
jgi:hypothetical protein